jgi:hypothetical protein
VGSSGKSSDAHRYFAVYYKGLPAETMYDSSTFFVVPPIYEGGLPSSVNYHDADPRQDVNVGMEAP